MEGAEATRSAVSFTFQKTNKASKVVEVEDKDFVSSLVGNKINSSKPIAQVKEYIILPQRARGRGNVVAAADKKREKEEEEDGKTKEEIQLDREAAEAVLKEVREAELRTNESEMEGPGHVISMLLQNRPAVEDKDVMADARLRPSQSTMEDYDSMPIGEFGTALLRGMGYKKGEALGKTNKGLVEPIEFVARPHGLGLGAVPKPMEPPKKRRIKKPGEETKKVQGPYVDKDGKVKHVKKIGEVIPAQPLKGFVVGNYALVAADPDHEGLYGKIVNVEEGTGHVLLKMAINDQVLSFSQHNLKLVRREEYRLGRPIPEEEEEEEEKRRRHRDRRRETKKEYGLIIKKGRQENEEPTEDPSEPKRLKTESGHQDPPSKRAPSSSASSNEHHHRIRTSSHHHGATRHHDDDRHHDNGHHHSNRTREKGDGHAPKSGPEKSSLKKSRSDFWLDSNLRVKMVDRVYRKKYYNTKMTVVDVVSRGVCVCQAEDGMLLEGVTQDMLETVVPRQQHSVVKMVRGKRKNQLATIIAQERAQAEAVIQMNLSKEVVKVSFDDICEYVGETEEM